VSDAEGDGLRRPGRLLLLGEAVLAYVAYQLLTYWYLPALRDSKQTFYGEVLVNGIAPDRTGGANYLKQGTWPSWARDSYGGVPYTANIQHAVFFPGNAPFLFLKTSAALEVVIATTVAFGAWAMYLYAPCAPECGRRCSPVSPSASAACRCSTSYSPTSCRPSP